MNKPGTDGTLPKYSHRSLSKIEFTLIAIFSACLRASPFLRREFPPHRLLQCLDKFQRSQRPALVCALPDRRMLILRALHRQTFSPQWMAPILLPGIQVQNGIRLRSTAVYSDTGPWIIFRLSNHPRAYRVKFSISQGGRQMRSIQRAGAKSPLPDMTAGGMADIPVGLVTPMRMLESQSQSIAFARNHNQVNMIGHEAIADQRKPMQSSIVSEQVKIDEPFSIRSENELPGIPTLGNVVRNTDGNHSSQTGQASKITDNVPSVWMYRNYEEGFSQRLSS